MGIEKEGGDIPGVEKKGGSIPGVEKEDGNNCGLSRRSPVVKRHAIFPENATSCSNR